MKTIIYIFGIIALAVIISLNLMFTANLSSGECITIIFNNFLYILGIIVTAILIYIETKILNRYLYKNNEDTHKKKIKTIFICTIIAYVAFNIIWVIFINPPVVGDSIHVCNLAQTFYRGDDELLSHLTYAGIPLIEYMEAYPQQLTQSFVFSVVFRIIHFDIMQILRYFNVICNVLTIIALIKIGEQLSKTYKINKVLLISLIATFIPLAMLSTFIYGDIPSLTLCLISVYFVMKYNETKKIKYPLISSILTMIAYMLRMNCSIFIIATTIYLILNLFKDITKKKLKENVIGVAVIIVYIAISIFPSMIVRNYYTSKYNLDKDKIYPNISYFLMAMEEAPRGNGWYNEVIAVPALNNPQSIKAEYMEKIKERIKFFSHNIRYTFDFYMMKTTSMWAENTHSAIWNNNFQDNKTTNIIINCLTFYEKAMLVLMCSCSLITLIHNRKNLSIDLIFLITIFIGGFAFHLLWEAKSRYIIPYIVVLMPIASIRIDDIKVKENFKKIFSKIKIGGNNV